MPVAPPMGGVLLQLDVEDSGRDVLPDVAELGRPADDTGDRHLVRVALADQVRQPL